MRIMGGQIDISSRRGSTDQGSRDALLCCYKFIRSPLFCIGTFILCGAAFNFVREDDAVATEPSATIRGVDPLRIEDDPILNSNSGLLATNNNDNKQVSYESEGAENNQPDTDAKLHENGLSIQPTALDHVKSLPPFPKIVHLIWNDTKILDKSYQMLEHGAKNLKRLNPDWQFIVHDFEDVNRTILEFNDHPDVMDKGMQEDLMRGHIVEKTDAFRLMTIYQTGGLYVDIDRVMNVKLNDIINVQTTKLVVPTHYDINFAQDLFGSSPGNNLILNVLKRQCEKRKTYPRQKGWLKSSDHMTLVYTYSNSLEMDLFGRFMRNGNETSNWNEARHLLNHHSDGAFVTKKDEWCDGLLVHDYDGCKAVSRADLYNDYGVVPWVQQVDEVWAKAAEPRG